MSRLISDQCKEVDQLKIAIVGTRGVPARYSGFETCAEELGSRLAQRGHDVTVYCRTQYHGHTGPFYKGMRRISIPTIENKYLDTIVHTIVSCLHAAVVRYDLIFMMIAGNAPAAIIPRLVGQRVVLNVDGLDWKREKWPAAAKKYIQWAEGVATWLPHALVTDSRVVAQYYKDRYQARPVYIPYGSEIAPLPPGETLRRFGLEPRGYILFVGRLVPENCAHHVTGAFAKIRLPEHLQAMKCVIVGDAPYADGYIARLRASAGPNVVFTGYCFGDGYRELGSNAYAFVESSGVGGTHPALLEAMGMGNCVVVNGTSENLETVGDTGFSYSGPDDDAAVASLAAVLQRLVNDPDLVKTYRNKARARASSVYTWSAVTEQYEKLFLQVGLGSRRFGGKRTIAEETVYRR
jgi:glycosyltransferase involved in cell wall biosynthesis